MNKQEQVTRKALDAITEKKLAGRPEKFVKDVKQKVQQILDVKLAKNPALTVQVYDKNAKRNEVFISKEPSKDKERQKTL